MAEVKTKFTADTVGVQKGIKSVGSSVTGLKSTVTGLGTAFKSAMAPLLALTAAVGGGAAILKGTKDILDYGGALSDTSNITGIAVKDLVVLQEAFRQAGISSELVQKAVSDLNGKLSLPTPKIIGQLQKLGITQEQIAKSSIGERFTLVASAIGKMTNKSDQLTASQVLFGRTMGTNLLNLFKTKDAMEQAQTTVGKLGDNMEKFANKFDFISDVIGGVGIKFRQLFAGLVGGNVDRLLLLAQKFNELDFSNLGESIGGFVKTFANALGTGEIFDAIWLQLKAIILKTGEFLISIFEIAGQHLAASIERSLEGTALGKYLDIGKVKHEWYYEIGDGWGSGGLKSKEVPYKWVEPESFNEAMKRNKNRFGSVNAQSELDLLALKGDRQIKQELADRAYTPPKEYTTADWQEMFAEQRRRNKEIIDNFNAANALKLQTIAEENPDKTRGIMTSSFQGIIDMVSKINPRTVMKGYEPVLSSLARIGGAKAFTENPLVDLQKQAIDQLKKIVDNTGKRQQASFA
jgi:hypothetical protein